MSPRTTRWIATCWSSGCSVASHLRHLATLERIVSGGQTGADRAALDWAIARGIPHAGWCPSGRRAEDGPIDPRYQLRQTPSRDYEQRTRWPCSIRSLEGVTKPQAHPTDAAGPVLETLLIAGGRFS